MGKKKVTLSACVFLLVATVVCYGFGCASLKRLTLSKHEKSMLDSFRKQVHETVPDPVRAEQVVAVGEDVTTELHDYFEKMGKIMKKCIKANADYDTTPDELASYFRALDENRRKIRKTLLKAQARITTLTTEQEWRALSNRKNSLKEFLEKHPDLF